MNFEWHCKSKPIDIMRYALLLNGKVRNRFRIKLEVCVEAKKTFALIEYFHLLNWYSKCKLFNRKHSICEKVEESNLVQVLRPINQAELL